MTEHLPKILKAMAFGPVNSNGDKVDHLPTRDAYASLSGCLVLELEGGGTLKFLVSPVVLAKLSHDAHAVSERRKRKLHRMRQQEDQIEGALPTLEEDDA